MIFKPWDRAQPDEWLPQSLRLCWGSGDSSDGGGGGNTGGGDWGSAGSYDASGFDAGGIGAWGGTAYDASVFGTGMGGGGDWGSFGDTNYAGFNAPNPTFADVAGPNPGVTTGGGDFGSAGTFSAAGTGGGPGGAMFGADTGAGGGSYGGGGGSGGGFWGGGDTGGGFYGDTGGGGMYGGGGGGGSFGSFGSGTLGGSNAYAAAPTGPTGSAFADSYGGGSLAGPAGQASSGAPTTSEAQSESADTSEGEAAPTDDAAPAVEATIAGGRETDFGAPAQSEAAPEDETAPAQDSFASRFDAVAPAQQDSFASRFDAATPNAEPSAFGPQSLDQQSAGEQGKAGQQQDSFDSRFGFETAAPQDTFDSRFGFDTSAPTPSIETTIPGGQQTDFDYGPGPQTAGPNFNQAFEAFNAPGWNLSEQTAGVTGLAEPTDWAANPYQPSTDVSVGRDFNQVFADVNGQLTNYEGAPYADMGPPPAGPNFDQSFQAFDTPTGMDLASDFATGRTTDLSNQLGLQDLTVGPGLPTGPAFGISGLNLNPLTHDTDQAVNVELVPADQMPAPPPPPPQDQPQALPAVQVQPTPEAQPAPQTPQEATPQAAPQAQPAPPQEAEPAPPGLVDMVPAPPPQEVAPAQPPGLVTMLPPPTLTPQTQPPGTPAVPPAPPAAPPDDHDAPEPQDTSQPPQDPNAPRPPENIPGQLTGSRGTYENERADNPRTNKNYLDSGRLDNPQGEPGITFRSARQAGVEPLFRMGDIDVGNVSARLVENVNRALRAMEQRTGIPANSLVATSGMRFAHRGGAIIHGNDPRTSQESVRSRGRPSSGGGGFPAAPPGHSNHGGGRALDFADSRARAWLRANAREFDLETLGGTFDMPHIQLRGGAGANMGARPSEQEQAEQRTINEQNRQAAIDRGLISPGGRGNQQAGVPTPRARPSDAPQPEVAQPRPPADVPAALPPPTMPLAPEPARPPADIPAPAPFLAPPTRGRVEPMLQTRFANDLLKDATKNLNKQSGEAEFAAASVVAAKALAAAGIPAAMARSLMAKGAYEGAAKNGFDINAFLIGPKIKSSIDTTIDAAMQGYQPAKPGEVQGPQGFQPDAPRALAKGGHVAKDEKVVVGEEGPEFFIPDEPGTVVPHQPQPGKGKNVDRWPKLPASEYPGRYGGVERESEWQTRQAQNPVPSLIDLVDSGRLPLNAANWDRLINNPSLIALGRSRFEDRRTGIEPGAEQYGAFIPPPAPAAEPPDPTSPMAQALGYGSIKRRPMQIGRQSY